uniref:Uncharacterized protein n=1 Tax=Anguilla anguilla TaxID=7936 RepID=A0A0E9UJB9_ANGAN
MKSYKQNSGFICSRGWGGIVLLRQIKNPSV